MARRSTKQLPLSIFATPAVRGFGEAGFMDADDDLHGLQSVLVARTLDGQGLGARRSPGRYSMIVRGMWIILIIDKPDLAKFYDVNGILAGHDSSRKVFERMRDDECLLETNWRGPFR
ncbi:hypothetical protein AB1Y20_018147 [Prymnesium parvum]|uniref:Uncharacterized protein n=1 Tax=Prymnesium parvum TaxID=97485 RepID=A0AB34JRG9_PRYPA